MSASSVLQPPCDLPALAVLSARIGANPLLVQGPGGNTSVKDDGLLWIKASGTLLADALKRSIFLPLDLAAVHAAVERGDAAAETCIDFVAQGSAGLRPSIETTMHAILPHRVVVHVHCVETIAWAVRSDAAAALAAPLHGLDWCFIPYVRPGLPLASAIRAVMTAQSSILILGNHGLVVGGDSVDAAAVLGSKVTARLRRRARAAPPPDLARLEALAAGTGYAPAPAAVHALATDPASLAIARGGSLYPDHVIFLGPGVAVLEPGAMIAAVEAGTSRPPPLLLVPGAGALMRRNAVPAAAALARCLADVTARIDPALALTRLTAADEDALTGWDAEKYRQAVARVVVA
jgi:rhamnose utilization protein RhaD (predicted bifunctional aldolase and dehydrogenase)